MFKKIIFTFLICLLTINSHGLPFKGSKVIISASSRHAVEAGQEIYRKGGNVVDVAVTVGLTLAVTRPYFAAFGGGGFAMVKLNGKSVDVLDYREVAPLATSANFYKNRPPKSSQNGGAAIAVPGVPMGLWALHKKYGKLRWQQLFKKPIKLAQKGFPVSGDWVQRTNKTKKRFNKSGKKYFFKKNRSYLPGEIIKQPQLAKALRKMRAYGGKAFYSGSIAKDIVKSIKESKGVITLEDLKKYKVRWLKPLKTNFEGYTIYLMPPPSSGGVVIQSALKLAKKINLKRKKAFSIDELHHIGEILSRSFRGRSLLGDPDFHKNPISFLTSNKYLNKMAKSIHPYKSKKLKPFKQSKFKESAQTTHYSILDKNGNAVSITVTLNGAYGSGVVTNKYGIAMNNEMDDFTTIPNLPNMFGLIQGPGNSIKAQKRPLSSMSPTIVTKNNKAIMAIGAPGGPRIISTVFQILYRSLASGYDIDDAIQAPRVHHQFLPHKLFIDKGYRFTPLMVSSLEKRKHKVERSWNAKGFGVKLNKNGILEGAFDSRGEGAVGGF